MPFCKRSSLFKAPLIVSWPWLLTDASLCTSRCQQLHNMASSASLEIPAFAYLFNPYRTMSFTMYAPVRHLGSTKLWKHSHEFSLFFLLLTLTLLILQVWMHVISLGSRLENRFWSSHSRFPTFTFRYRKRMASQKSALSLPSMEGLIPKMLASPISLLNICINRGNDTQARQVLKVSIVSDSDFSCAVLANTNFTLWLM